MLRYIILVYLFLKKKAMMIEAQEEFEANFKVFKEEIEADYTQETKRILELEAKNQGERSVDEEYELADLQETVDRAERLKKMKKKALREIESADKVVEALKDKVLFRG